MKSCEIFLLLKIRTMATNFSPCKGSYVLNQFPSNVMFGMNGFHVSASGAIQGHHGPLVIARLSTTCSRGAFRVVMCQSSTISLNIFSSQTTGPIWIKLGRNVPWEILFKNFCRIWFHQKLWLPWQRNLNFLSNSLKIFSGTEGLILKLFHRNVPWVTLFKNSSRNFDPPINMALVNAGFLHYRDMKKLLKNLLLWNCW